MAIPTSVNRLVDDKAGLIDGAVNTVGGDMTSIQRRIFASVKKQLRKYPSKGGFFVFDNDTSAEATQLTLEIEREIFSALQGSKYPGNVGKYLKDYNGIIDLNKGIHKSLNDISPEAIDDLIDPFLKQSIAATTEQLTGAGMSDALIKPVQQSLQNNVIAGANIEDAESTLRAFIEGDSKRLGALDRYVGQISRDSISQFDGMINGNIAEEFELDAFRYVGSLIIDSRPQCKRWVSDFGGILPIDTLQNQIDWAKTNGTGYIPGTNPKNFASLRGGYNCRHQAIPFKLSDEEKKQAAKAAIDNPIKARAAQIKEVKNSIKQNKQKIKTKTKATAINKNQILSTQKESFNNDALNVISDSDGANEIANEFSTSISFRQLSQGTAAGTRRFLNDTGSNKRPHEIGPVRRGEGGNCAIDNSFLNIRVKRADKIRFEKIDYSVDEKALLSLPDMVKANDRKYGEIIHERNGNIVAFRRGEGWKQYAVGSNVPENIAPTITHESGHLIQNKFDPTGGFGTGRNTMKDLMKKREITLKDSVTVYGETNNSEFFAENYTAYVYSNSMLKKKNKKVFDFIEELLDLYGIDKKTIKIAK